MPAASAAALSDHPATSTRSINSARPLTLRRALPCSFIRCPPWDWWLRHQPASKGHRMTYLTAGTTSSGTTASGRLSAVEEHDRHRRGSQRGPGTRGVHDAVALAALCPRPARSSSRTAPPFFGDAASAVPSGGRWVVLLSGSGVNEDANLTDFGLTRETAS